MTARNVVLASVCLAGTACGGAPASTDATGDCVRSRPRVVRGLSAGERYSLAVLENGDALLWGEVLSYMGGDGKRRQLLVPPLSVDTGCRRTVEVAAGWWHACVRIDDGEVRCWGRNDAGQLGITGNTTAQLQPATPASLGPGRSAVALAAGYQHTCARLDNGQVKCWGLNRDGQLGLGDTSPRLSPTTAVALGDGRTAVEIAAGFAFACARLDDGTVKCWGDNASGQVGVGDSEGRSSPTNAVDLGTGLKAVEIAAGLIHVCARLDSGIVKCWGDNDGRQLGIPDPLNRGGRPDELGDNLPAVPIGD